MKRKTNRENEETWCGGRSSALLSLSCRFDLRHCEVRVRLSLTFAYACFRVPIRKAGVNHKALKVVSHLLQNQPELLPQFLELYKASLNTKRSLAPAVEPIFNFLNAQVFKSDSVIFF